MSETVKIKVSLELEVPDHNYADQGLLQLISDNFVQFTVVQCAMEELSWTAKIAQEGENSYGGHQKMVDHFHKWREIIRKGSNTLKVEVIP